MQFECLLWLGHTLFLLLAPGLRLLGLLERPCLLRVPRCLLGLPLRWRDGTATPRWWLCDLCLGLRAQLRPRARGPSGRRLGSRKLSRLGLPRGLLLCPDGGLLRLLSCRLLGLLSEFLWELCLLLWELCLLLWDLLGGLLCLLWTLLWFLLRLLWYLLGVLVFLLWYLRGLLWHLLGRLLDWLGLLLRPLL